MQRSAAAKSRVRLDLQPKVYVDCKLRVFTYTAVPLSRFTHYPIVGSNEALSDLRKSLTSQGYVETTRRTFEAICNGEVTV